MNSSLTWTAALSACQFPMRALYLELPGDKPLVPWRKFWYSNKARPRAMFCTWMAFNNWLATKDRVRRWNTTLDPTCFFCSQAETQQHLLFECPYTHRRWLRLLRWLKISRSPLGWDAELQLMCRRFTGKSWKSNLLKTAFAETVYAIWIERNTVCFQQKPANQHLEDKIIDVLINRAWADPRLRAHCTTLMLDW